MQTTVYGKTDTSALLSIDTARLITAHWLAPNPGLAHGNDR